MIYRFKYFHFLFPIISIFLISCAGGGGGGISNSSSSRFDTSDVTNSAGSSFGSGTSASYTSSTSSTWAGRSQFDNVLYTSTFDGATSSQNPYEIMNIHKAYGYGLSGDGTTVYIHDSNFDVDHQTFADKSVSAWQSNYYSDTTSRFHGNSVASVAIGNYDSSDSGTIMGVAYNADLFFSDYSIRKSGYSDFGLHYSWALSQGAPSNTAAYNNSWGIAATIKEVKEYKSNNNLSTAQTVAAYMNAAGLITASNGVYTQSWINNMNEFQDDKGVIVWALGNHSDDGWDQYSPHFLAALPELDSSLKDAWITVGTVDINGSSGNESYRKKYQECGDTASYCLVTDSYGVNVAAYENANSGSVDTDGNSSFWTTGISGNSFGAPMVSGSVALLAEAFPTLNPSEWAARLFATADNTFFTSTSTATFANGVKHGFSADYGHGIPDVYKALQPITSNMLGNSILIGENINSSSHHSLEESNLNLGSAFGDSVDRAVNNKVGYFHDALYGYFPYDSSKLVNTEKINSSINQDMNIKEINTDKNSEESSYFVSFVPSVIDNQINVEDTKGVTFFSSVGEHKVFSSFYNPLELSMGFIPLKNSNAPLVFKDGFGIPFVKDSINSLSFGGIYKISNTSSFSVGMFESDNKYGKKNDLISISYNRENNNSYSSLIMGIKNEEDSFLGSGGNGAYDLTETVSPTTFVGLNYSKFITSDIDFMVNGSLGITSMNSPDERLLSDISQIVSSSFGAALTINNFKDINNSLVLSISQPHRVENGEANLIIPGYRDKNGNLSFKSEKISLSPTGREIEFGITYNKYLNSNTLLSFGTITKNNSNHNKDNTLENSFIYSIKYNF